MAHTYPGFPADDSHPCGRDTTLAETTRQLLVNSLSVATQQAYAAGQSCYLSFCRRFRLPPVPASDETLAYFVGHMRRSGLALATARQYLAAVRRLHLQSGRPLPPGLPPFTDAAIHGYQVRMVRPSPRERLPLTVNQLCRLKTRLPRVGQSLWDQRCIWAACTLAFYGGLRSSEYLVTCPGRGLTRQDVYITSACCAVRLGVLKTRQHGQPMCITLPATSTDTCPVRSLQQYVVARDACFPSAAPLFVMQDGTPLSRRHLNSTLRAVLGPGFSSHSLRIGIATSACEAGVDDSVIRRLGRWSSEAFDGYVRCQRPAVSRALRLVSASVAPPHELNPDTCLAFGTPRAMA